MVRLFNYLLQQKHLGSALVQLGGLEPPTSCSADRRRHPCPPRSQGRRRRQAYLWRGKFISPARRSVGRAAQLRSAFRFGRLGSRLGFDRLDPGALDLRGLDVRGHLYRSGPLRRMQRTWPRHRPRHQHLGCALMTEIAICEGHAGDRAAEAALVVLVEVEAGLEWNALDRGTDGLAANLERIA